MRLEGCMSTGSCRKAIHRVKTLNDDQPFVLPSIERDVPLPPRRFDGSHPFSLLRQLKPGESVFFRGVLTNTTAYHVLSNRTAYLKRTQGFMLTMRSVVEDGTKGVRVWRRA